MMNVSIDLRVSILITGLLTVCFMVCGESSHADGDSLVCDCGPAGGVHLCSFTAEIAPPPYYPIQKTNEHPKLPLVPVVSFINLTRDDKAGIVWQAKIRVPANWEGKYKFVQNVKLYAYKKDKNGICWEADKRDKWYLDSGNPYPGQGGSGDIDYSDTSYIKEDIVTSDTPCERLPYNIQLEVDYEFIMYFMVQKTGGPWQTLATMHWAWEVKATGSPDYTYLYEFDLTDRDWTVDLSSCNTALPVTSPTLYSVPWAQVNCRP
jgi:hypothetical protein